MISRRGIIAAVLYSQGLAKSANKSVTVILSSAFELKVQLGSEQITLTGEEIMQALKPLHVGVPKTDPGWAPLCNLGPVGGIRVRSFDELHHEDAER